MKGVIVMKYHYIFDKNAEPYTRLKPGEKITVETEDAFRGIVKKEEECTVENIEKIFDLSNPLTGPVVVEGAEPGNWVEIFIEDIECGTYGVSIIGKHFCIYGDEYDKYHAKVAPIKDGIIHFNDKIKIPVRPMIGTIGTTPGLEAPGSCAEGIYGGNMDAPSVGIGNRLYLPVFIEGAYIYMGDCHAVQGDGELVNPFEMQAKITFTVDVVKDKSSAGKCPRVHTKDTIETIASDRTFYWAAKAAMRDLIEWMVDDYGFSFNDAAFLCGQVADARCCQIGNSYHTARAVIDLKYVE
jgi:amidase